MLRRGAELLGANTIAISDPMASLQILRQPDNVF
jgi:hypothetical protein